jgi:hypothetical protein
MVDVDKVNSAIEAFDNWHQPWTFYDSVIAYAEFGEIERNTIDAIWLQVCDKSIWLSGTIQECCMCIEKVISKNFPWLSVQARKQVINGAAYQWK